MSQKKITNPFNAFKTYKGQSGFDTDYIERHITKVVHKTGPGENDYIIVDKVTDIKKNIKDFIAVDAESVGLYNMLKQLVRAEGKAAQDQLIAKALDPKGVNIHDCNDFTDAPRDLMDACEKAKNLEKFYNSLPAEIKKGRTAKEFFSNFTDKEIKTYFSNIYDKVLKVQETATKKAEIKETPKEIIKDKESK